MIGLYLPNRSEWNAQDWQDIEYSQTKLGVWRTDADPSAPSKLKEMGIDVIAQCPDVFSGQPFSDPWFEIRQVYNTAIQYCPIGTRFVLDNEPNLFENRYSRWFAEQYTRYLRAKYAYWRWLDASGNYPLIFPALVPNHLTAMWYDIGIENIRESDSIGVHCYWQTEKQMNDVNFGKNWLPVTVLQNPWQNPPVNKPITILEFANTTGHACKTEQYTKWNSQIPDDIQRVMFILNPTDDWKDLSISGDTLEWIRKQNLSS